MTDDIDLSQEPDLGYVFYPPTDENGFGGNRFDVVLTEHPTLRHYDPHRIQVTLVYGRDGVSSRIHHSNLPGNFRVCPGRVVLTDRVGKQVEVFCFGGTLEIIAQSPETICVFQSPVPILDLRTYHSTAMLFANEVEILIAQRRAAWDPEHPHRFEEHLAQVDPVDLYVACLQELKTKFTGNYPINDPVYHEFVHLLGQEIEAFKQNARWPTLVPKLADLL